MSAPANTDLRLYGLEGMAATQDAAITRLRDKAERHDEALGKQAITLAEHEIELTDHGKAIEKLAATVDKAVWALLGFALTVAGAVVVTNLPT